MKKTHCLLLLETICKIGFLFHSLEKGIVGSDLGGGFILKVV
jgi:hypothetical protein